MDRRQRELRADYEKDGIELTQRSRSERHNSQFSYGSRDSSVRSPSPSPSKVDTGIQKTPTYSLFPHELKQAPVEEKVINGNEAFNQAMILETPRPFSRVSVTLYLCCILGFLCSVSCQNHLALEKKS